MALVDGKVATSNEMIASLPEDGFEFAMKKNGLAYFGKESAIIWMQ